MTRTVELSQAEAEALLSALEAFSTQAPTPEASIDLRALTQKLSGLWSPEEWEAWWEAKGESLTWDSERRYFE